jgi:DNA-binding transcriptional ArsR family regulator
VNEKIIKTLGNPIRLNLISCLSKKSKTVTQMIESCGLSQSAVSQHLTKLRSAGLVKDTKKGREVYYSLTSKKLANIAKLIINL